MPMRLGRWYPTATELSTGEVVILAGRDQAGQVVTEPEIWSSGTIRSLTGAPRVFPYYPRAFLAPNGRVFYAGEQQATRYLNTAGKGSWTTVGSRLYGVRDYGSAVMYDVGKILYVGGGHTTNTAEIIDLNSAAPTWQWTGSMVNPRRHLNATVLPTGQVLVTGGLSGTGWNDLTTGVHAAELWNPATGTWTVLASNTITRGYHATSILMPDGRVLHAGSGDGGGSPDEENAELFSPPYLFKGARPTITSAPTSIAYNTTFQVTTPQASDIGKVSLIHLGAATHAFDMGQRFQWLSFQRQTGALSITGPTSRNVTPPGHYMLFILDTSGVPSVAKIIQVGGSSNPPPPPNNAPTAAFSQTCTGLSCAFTDASTDGDGTVTGWSWNFGDGGSATTRNPSHTYTGGGTYTVTLVATDDDGANGSASKAITVTQPQNTAPIAAFNQTCTGLSCSFTDGSTDSDGAVAGWSWDFGDGTGSASQNPNHTYASAGTYAVSLEVTDDDGATASSSHTVTVTAAAANLAPTAAFAVSCTALVCRFYNRSTDSDGSIVATNWTFGDGATATATNPTRTYAAAGTYTVTLLVTDDDGATNQRSQSITNTTAIKLTVTGQVDATNQNVTLQWTGARGTDVKVYLNRALLRQEPNDGLYTYSQPLPGSTKYTFSVCELGTTTICSNEASVTF